MTDSATITPTQHTVPIPRGQYSASITPPWFVDKSEYTPKLASFKPLVNGEEAFREVYLAIEAAKHSVCYICWAFQPSMYFIRDGQHLMIGELLEKKAREGVMIRVLCWAFDLRFPGPPPLDAHTNVTGIPKGLEESNTPGRWHLKFFDRTFGSTNAQYEYDCRWYSIYDRKQALHDEIIRLGIRTFSDADYQSLRKNLIFTSRTYSIFDNTKIARMDFVDEISVGHRAAVALLPSHHQKVVTVDHDDAENAVGFVMGHNTLDNYWDIPDHSQLTHSPNLGRNARGPLHDYSSRVTGPIVGDLFRNFAQAWKRETYQTLPIPKFDKYQSRGSDPRAVCQILRTQPQHGRADIMNCYLQAVANATQYIAIENQYFRWPPLAAKIKQCAAGQTQWGRKPEQHGDLYLFVITNSSDAGMGKGTVKTYQMLNALGRADTIPEVARDQRMGDIDKQLDDVDDQIDGVNDQIEDADSDIKRLDSERRGLDQQARLLQGVPGASGSMTDQYVAINRKMEPLEARKKALEGKTKTLEAKKKELEASKARLQPLTQHERDIGADRTPEAIQQESIPGLKVHVATLVAPDTEAGLEWQEVYIHAKLMMIDDTFMTMGSANINTRSMQTDSEMNIAHHRPEITGPLRQQQWAKYTGGRVSPGMSLSDSHRKWGALLQENANNKKRSQRPVCQLAEFLRMSPEVTNGD